MVKWAGYHNIWIDRDPNKKFPMSERIRQQHMSYDKGKCKWIPVCKVHRGVPGHNF